MIDAKTVFDELETRCPRLGGTVMFDYCRKAGSELPCSRSLICWEHAFPVGEYMLRILNRDEWRSAFETPPKHKMEVILEAAMNT